MRRRTTEKEKSPGAHGTPGAIRDAGLGGGGGGPGIPFRRFFAGLAVSDGSNISHFEELLEELFDKFAGV